MLLWTLFLHVFSPKCKGFWLIVVRKTRVEQGDLRAD
jgi:hypothetical protein